MTQIRRSDDGMYHIKGKTYSDLTGTRARVYNGSAYKTTGGLLQDDLVKNKWDRIVSKSKYESAKKEQRLKAHGYTAKKGKFGAVKMRKRRTQKNKSRRNNK